MSKSNPDEVELERDHYWWLHPGLRGREAMAGKGAASLPWRWSTHQVEQDAPAPRAVEPHGPYADFAKLLYKMNGYRPGLVTGWYVVVAAETGGFAVGQLCVDPHIPVVLFSDLVYADEDQARAVAAELRAAKPGLVHRR